MTIPTSDFPAAGPADDIALTDQAGHLIRRAHQLAVALFHENLGRDVTPVQYAVLRALERAVAEGKVRSIGISNFESDRLEELCKAATIKPSVLQVECHPFYQQRALKERVAKYGTAIECWYPLGHADAGLLGNEAIVRIAEAHGKSAAQVILRWHVQTGNIVFPKSTNPAHLAANLDVFDFVLAPDEMAAIDALDCGKRFFNMTLEQQERTLGAFAPED